MSSGYGCKLYERMSHLANEPPLATDDSCPVPANAILLNPVDHGLIGWDELWGLPVLADDRVPTKRVRIQCDGSAFGIEDEVADAVAREEPIVIPVVVPVGPGDEPGELQDRSSACRHVERPPEGALEELDLT